MTSAEATSPTLVLHRARRLRQIDSLRRIVREIQISVNGLIYPFCYEGKEQKIEIALMLGCDRTLPGFIAQRCNRRV